MKKVEVYEVGPRDGFQNIKEYIPLADKIKVINGLVEAGINHVQITSFVSSKAIPQMKDAKELAAICLDQHPEADFFALVPNLRGAQAAKEVGMKWVSYVVSLSESHNQANIRRNHEASFTAFQQIRDAYPDLDVCLDLATTFGCPFEGKKTADDVLPFIKPYVEGGLKTLNLCDTIGIANPQQVRDMVQAVKTRYPRLDLQIHIHDTRNMGMVNTLAAIELGVDKVQSTLGGLGGCPYAPGASGNLATEDLVYMLSEMGYDMGVDIAKMVSLAKQQKALIPNGVFSGHIHNIGVY